MQTELHGHEHHSFSQKSQHMAEYHPREGAKAIELKGADKYKIELTDVKEDDLVVCDAENHIAVLSLGDKDTVLVFGQEMSDDFIMSSIDTLTYSGKHDNGMPGPFKGPFRVVRFGNPLILLEEEFAHVAIYKNLPLVPDIQVDSIRLKDDAPNSEFVDYSEHIN